MSRSFACDLTTMQRFPRVSGDEPSLALSASRVIAFSPRERG